MPTFNKRKISWAAIALFVIGAATAMIWHYIPWESSADVSNRGGDAWNSNHVVGVRVAAGGVAQTVKITFRKPDVTPARAPMGSLVDIIGKPVDITPNHTIASDKVQVLFKMPSSIPIHPTSKSGKHQRSIQNAGIEVYNENLNAWIPLDTKVEGDTLVANAPHFSDYRAVWTKIGNFPVNADMNQPINVTVDEESNPTDLPWKIGLAFMAQTYRNMSGTFDPEKMKACEKPSSEYTISFGQTLDASKIDACVIEQDHTNKLLIQNGWAVPMRFSTSAVSGVTADDVPTSLEMTTYFRNKLAGALGKNIAMASGLDTTSFTIDADAPDSFTVTGNMSWTGTIVDLELAVFGALFPESALAEHIGFMTDIANCAVLGAQTIPGMPADEIPGKMAEILKSCATPALLYKFGAGELLNAIAKETRLIPELAQLATATGYSGITGQDMTQVSFTVNKPVQALRGLWTYECGGSDNFIKFEDDGNGEWEQKDYDAQNHFTTRDTYFRVTFEAGEPILVVSSSQLPGLTKGTKLDITPIPSRNGVNKGLTIAGSNDSMSWVFYWPGGASYC